MTKRKPIAGNYFIVDKERENFESNLTKDIHRGNFLVVEREAIWWKMSANKMNRETVRKAMKTADKNHKEWFTVNVASIFRGLYQPQNDELDWSSHKYEAMIQG